ncbi:tetratricopeptide repeat protein [Agrobacterium sp. NPDC090273]|uniref:tetratricopeptide repeat protein n=1 Tax=Agrobacterium sp. NPDC090273 TaxID=3363919 RepID=UPI00383AEF65
MATFKIGKAFLFSRHRKKVLSAGLLIAAAVFAVQPAQAQVALPLQDGLMPSPDFDYAPICKVRAQQRNLSYDWSKWDGGPVKSNLDDMLLDAQAYIGGTGNAPRDKVLARRMLEYLKNANYELAGRASHTLGRLMFDATSGSPDLGRGLALQDEAIARGFMEGATFLGRLYATGEVVPQDKLKGEKYLKMGAQNGDPDAALLLARLYRNNPELAPSEEAPQLLFNQAIDKLSQSLGAGECDVLTLFSGIYANEEFGLFNPQLSAKWLMAAAKAGNFVAVERLSQRYMIGDGVPVDRNKAVELLETAAARGHAGSRISLARLLLANLDLKDALPKATQALKQEAERGNVRAFELLAQISHGDFGGKPNYAAMVGYLEQAARNPVVDTDVLKQLGSAYASGTGTARNTEKAVDYLTRAVALGSDTAALELYQLMVDSSHNISKSVNPIAILRRAANNGLSEAMATLSDAYSCGIGVERNADIGRRWQERAAAGGNRPSLIAVAKQALTEQAGDDGKLMYFRNIRRAAALGDRRAMVLLSLAYRDGVGTNIDTREAGQWYEKALAAGQARGQALVLLARLQLSSENADKTNVKAAVDLLKDGLSSGDTSVRYDLAKLYLKGAAGLAPQPDEGIKLLVEAARLGHTASMIQLADLGVDAKKGGGRTADVWLGQAVDDGDIRAILKTAERAGDQKSRRTMFDLALKQPLCSAKDEVALADAISRDANYARQTRELVDRALASETDDASTLYQLANLLNDNKRGVLNPELALTTMVKSAEAGKVEAMRESGRMFLLSPHADPGKATQWLLAAVRAGDDGALKTLVEQLVGDEAPETSTNPIVVEALPALEDAAKGGSGNAIQALARVLSIMAKEDGAYSDKARVWMTKAAETGDGAAMVMVADAFATGTSGFPLSAADSTGWLARAAISGYPKAFEPYAIALQIGYGVPPDPQEAERWLGKAATITQ